MKIKNLKAAQLTASIKEHKKKRDEIELIFTLRQRREQNENKTPSEKKMLSN